MSNYNDLVYIYCLIDPRDGRIRYVGMTRNPKKRLRYHSAPSGIPTERRRRWTEELRASRLKPSLSILEYCNSGSWAERERFWIALLSKSGDLLNCHPGGTGKSPLIPEVLSEDRRLLLRKTEAQKNKIRDANLQTWTDPKLIEQSRTNGLQGAQKQWASMTSEQKTVHMAKLQAGRARYQSHVNISELNSIISKNYWKSLAPKQRQEFISRHGGERNPVTGRWESKK